MEERKQFNNIEDLERFLFIQLNYNNILFIERSLYIDKNYIETITYKNYEFFKALSNLDTILKTINILNNVSIIKNDKDINIIIKLNEIQFNFNFYGK